MIEITERQTADTWPPLRHTNAGGFLLTQSLPELVQVEKDLVEGLARMTAGEDLECGDLDLLVSSG